jgi:HK97 family phage prohead protease
MTQRKDKTMSKLPEGVEFRYRPAAEFRADSEGESMTLRGHAATFGDVYDLGPFDERFAAGAFDDVLTDDVRALWNHDANTVLGRTKSGTLRLSVDERGLMTEIDLPESAMALREAIARGDVDQMSHGFTVEKDTWETTDKETGRELRTIEKVGTLYDVSPVTFPANPNTDVALRSLGLAKDDRTPVEEVLETEDESNTLSLVEAKRLLDLKKD